MATQASFRAFGPATGGRCARKRCQGRTNAQAAQVEGAQTSRRGALLTPVAAALLAATPLDSQALPFFDAAPKVQLPPDTVQDQTLAYQFKYPTVTASGRSLPIATSRKPEKYSSAAPLNADARQRIVCELVSLQDGITYAMFVGPAGGTLLTTPVDEWTAKQVATVVLTDRSVSRNTTGQRVPIASLEASETVVHDATRYYVYETIQQGSPNLYDASKDTYRLSLCVTAVRPGMDGMPYLYTLSMSCPSVLWGDLEAGFREAADSFRLLPVGKAYVPPDKDPWLFF